jgi:hypothetical protein
MADGILNKCKECNKSDVQKNRKDKIDHYRNYDRKRGNRQSKEYISAYRKNNPLKYKAHTIVNNAVRDGRLIKQRCEICGNKRTHAHHDDYNYPLIVRWLCAAHHKEYHMQNNEENE